MSCWATAGSTGHGAHKATNCPQQAGAITSAPLKCAVCGWFTTRSGTCVNPGCGARAQKLQQAAAWPQPSQQAAQDWKTLGTQAVASSATPVAEWTALGLSQQSYDYLQTVGIPPVETLRALQRSPGAAWMYLARCPHCSAWVSTRTGICKNPRCSHGKDNAKVVEATGWTWPPKEKNLRHIQMVVEDTAGSIPDAHAAWHERNHRLCNKTVRKAELPAYLKELREHAQLGQREGWLDAASPAFDRSAAALLQKSAERTMKRMSDAELHHYAVESVNWNALTLSGPMLRDYFNPVRSPSTTGAQEMGARLFANMSAQPASDGDMQDLAGRVSDGLIAMGMHSEPAFPPSDWPAEFAEAVRQKSFPDATAYQSHPAYAYGAIAAQRLTPGKLPMTVQAQAAQTLQQHGATLGYTRLTSDQAVSVVANGWSPAQASAHFRGKAAAEVRLRDALLNATDVTETYKAGQSLRRLAQRMARTQPDQGRPWEQLDIPPVANTYTDNQMRALTGGAGAGVLTHAPREVQEAWLGSVATGYPHSWPEGQATTATTTQLIPLLEKRKLLQANDQLQIESADTIAVKSGAATTRYRVRTRFDAAGDLVTRFEKVKDV